MVVVMMMVVVANYARIQRPFLLLLWEGAGHGSGKAQLESRSGIDWRVIRDEDKFAPILSAPVRAVCAMCICESSLSLVNH